MISQYTNYHSDDMKAADRTTVFSISAILMIALVAVVALFTMLGPRTVYVSTGDSPVAAEPVLEQPTTIEQVEKLMETPVEVPETVGHIHGDGVVHQHDVPEETSLAEQYYQRYLTTLTGYKFTVGCDIHGDMKVHVKEGVTTYKAVDQLFEYDEETGSFVSSTYHSDITQCYRKDPDEWTKQAKGFLSDVEKEKIDVINYVEWDTVADTHKGCFILLGSSSLDNCVENKSGEPIIHEDFTFLHPKSPHDYLIDRFGEEPIEVRENREFKSRTMGNKVLVDEVEYRNRDGSRTVLYVHTYYGLPVEVEHIGEPAPVYFDNIVFYLRE